MNRFALLVVLLISASVAGASTNKTFYRGPMMVDSNGVITAPTNWRSANDIASATELTNLISDLDLTDSESLRIFNIAYTGANVIAASVFDTTNGWAFSGNASWNAAASNAAFASGGSGTLTTSTNIPTGIYILERWYNPAGGTNVVTWSTGLETGTDTVSAAVGYTTTVSVAGPLSLAVTPTHNIYADGVYLSPYTGGHVTVAGHIRAAGGVFGSVPTVGTNLLSTTPDLLDVQAAANAASQYLDAEVLQRLSLAGGSVSGTVSATALNSTDIICGIGASSGTTMSTIAPGYTDIAQYGRSLTIAAGDIGNVDDYDIAGGSLFLRSGRRSTAQYGSITLSSGDNYTLISGSAVTAACPVAVQSLSVGSSSATWITNIIWYLNASTNLVATTNIYLGRSP